VVQPRETLRNDPRCEHGEAVTMVKGQDRASPRQEIAPGADFAEGRRRSRPARATAVPGVAAGSTPAPSRLAE